MSSRLQLSHTETLEDRLARGAEMLFALEMRGETGPEYEKWLRLWTALLDEYEQREDAVAA